VFSSPAKIRSFSDGTVSRISFTDLPGYSPGNAELLIAELERQSVVDADRRITNSFDMNQLQQSLEVPGVVEKHKYQVIRILERIKNPAFTFIDGCMFANNTSLCSIMEAGKISFPDRDVINPSVDDIILVSLGTGTNDEIEPYDEGIDDQFKNRMMNILYGCPEKLAHFQCLYLFSMAKCEGQYFRLEPYVRQVNGYPSTNVMNISKENVKSLFALSKSLVEQESAQLKRIADLLVG